MGMSFQVSYYCSSQGLQLASVLELAHNFLGSYVNTEAACELYLLFSVLKGKIVCACMSGYVCECVCVSGV